MKKVRLENIEIDLKEKLNIDRSNYFEIKLEDLPTFPENNIGKICDFLKVPNSFDHRPELRLEKVNYWQNTMSKTDIEMVNKRLGTYIAKVGYRI